MYKRVPLLLLFTICTAFLFAQKSVSIKLTPSKEKSTNIEKVKKTPGGLILNESFSTIELKETETKEGIYQRLSSLGTTKSYDAGKPDLPVISKLIEIPLGSKAQVRIIRYDEQIVELTEYDVKDKIMPAQPSVEKNKDPKDLPFYKDQKVYKQNSFFKNELIKFEDRGFLRNKHLGYIEISPFQYNPVSNTLKVLNNIEIEVSFIADGNKTVNAKTLQSPYFTNITNNTINKIEETKAIISGPVKYVIVSDPMFEETLQPFIEWKTMKGFNVIAAYTDDPNVGTTTTSIKAYLKNLYDNPEDGVSPTFVLIVGDVAQIPAFYGSAGSHYTDLYYCEYTGDKLPEVFYGRFSAENVDELQAQIEKTLEVEKYEMPNPSYLNNVVLVAGVDNTYAPDYGNGAVNYLNNYYTKESSGVTSYYYLFDDASGVMASNAAGAGESVRNNINRGVSFSNYTAHCSVSGWADPAFNTSHIANLSNEHMYPLLIGNCCQSNTFYENDCFGERILQASKKGAVGYIGGSNNTLWDEDYYWGVGLVSTIVANPTYENSGLGSFDRFFHSNGEAKQDWYITQGQINVAGNLAVEASSSTYKNYYWEIYHLMGDPSLTPYISVPSVLISSYETHVIENSLNIEVSAEEDAYVAISKKGILFDAKLVSETGKVTLSLDSTMASDTLDIVITKQNCQPVIDKIFVLPRTAPYVVLDTFIIDDALENGNNLIDYGESVNFDIQLKNLSDGYDAFLVKAELSSLDTNVVITDNTEDYGTILKSANSLINKAFSIDFKNKIDDQYTVNFELNVTGEDSEGNKYSWISKLEVKVNAPVIKIGDIIFDDSNTGNNDSIMDAGETGDILLIVSNEGNDSIINLSGVISILGDGVSNLSLNSSSAVGFALRKNQTDTIKFNVTAGSGMPIGKNLFFLFEIDDQDFNYYSVSGNKELFVGGLNDVLISVGDTIITNSANFYDSGGKNNTYSNNEEYIITFMPGDANAKLMVDFISFNVEEDLTHGGCYDYLRIYDGDTISEDLLGEFCNTNKPSKIIATNNKGSLTFRFYSDGSELKSGWEAKIRTYVPHEFQLTVSDSKGPLEGVKVEFGGKISDTKDDGTVIFDDVSEGIDIALKATAVGYKGYSSTIDLLENVTESITLEKEKYNVKFYIFDENNELADSTSINFMGETQSSFTEGEYLFSNIEYCLNEKFVISKEGYDDYIDSIDVNSNKSLKITLEKRKPVVTFKVQNSENNPLDEVKIVFNGSEKLTSREGIATFERIELTKGLQYVLTRTRYDNFNGTIDVEKDTTVTITMLLNTGIEGFNNDNIKVYPNPSGGIFNLEINELQYSYYQISIYNVIGSKVYNKEVNGIGNIKELIDISDNNSGIYFLIVKSGEGLILSKKILKN